MVIYFITVMRQVNKDRKRRKKEWDKNMAHVLTLLGSVRKINSEWQNELNTWRGKRLKLEAAIESEIRRRSNESK